MNIDRNEFKMFSFQIFYNNPSHISELSVAGCDLISFVQL